MERRKLPCISHAFRLAFRVDEQQRAHTEQQPQTTVVYCRKATQSSGSGQEKPASNLGMNHGSGKEKRPRARRLWSLECLLVNGGNGHHRTWPRPLKLTCCLAHLCSSLTSTNSCQSLRHCNSLLVIVVLGKHQLHQPSTISKMRVCKAPELLKKAVTAFKSKTDAMRTKLPILASLRRRMAMVGAMSRRIHALMSSDREKQDRLEYGDKALVLRKAMAASQEPAAADHERDGMIDLSEVAIFDEDDHGYPDWTHSLFDDDNCYNDDDEDGRDDRDDLDSLVEPSVIEIIRSNREVEGLEFNMDDEIDQACDMFIKRFRKRMNRSF
ncbi:uncharacterized protein LOC133897031 [Phragmites australis]|uniref:uncharacterized protein LOC133897031 n=1 Tax=Phragmites australis TaxID=29695 RepID=UPI002D7981E4|nr:uncharacterized protein LOC133897031 [Phragmites australis]